jgi:hypothetical protein
MKQIDEKVINKVITYENVIVERPCVKHAAVLGTIFVYKGYKNQFRVTKVEAEGNKLISVTVVEHQKPKEKQKEKILTMSAHFGFQIELVEGTLTKTFDIDNISKFPTLDNKKKEKNTFLPEIEVEPKSGNEIITYNRGENIAKIFDFWKWYASDIISNTTRG